MFYKKKYRSAVAELEEAKKLCAEQGRTIQSAKTMYDNMLTENDNLLGRISSQKEALEYERGQKELLLKQNNEIAEDVAKLTESNNSLKRELHIKEEALKESEHNIEVVLKQMDTLKADCEQRLAEQTESNVSARIGDCEGCLHKVTKNYRKCGSCTRNVNAVDKFVLANEVLPSDVAIGEVPTAEEAANVTEQAELQTGELELPKPVDLPKETVPNSEHEPNEAPKAKPKHPKKKNRKRNR